MASIVVGSVAVDVIPNAMNFASDLRGQIEGPVDAVGQEVGQNLSDAIIEHLSDAIPAGLADGVPESAALGDEAGARFGDAFSTQIRAKIDAALKSLPNAEIDADTDEAMAKLADLRQELLSLDGFIDIEGNEDEVLAQLRDIRDELGALALESPEIRVRIDAAKAQADLDELLAKIAALDAASLAVHPDDPLSNIGAEAQVADKEIQGATSSVGGFTYALGALALVAAPVLGVLAAGAADLVIGIKNASVETGGLKSAWQDLEAEAGKEISPGLQVAVDGLTRALPQLDPLIDTLSTDLGDALGKAGQWLGNGGATEVVDYLKTEIPIVGGLFESLGSAFAGFVQISQGPANVLLNVFKEMADAATTVEGALNGKLPSSNNNNGPDFGASSSSVTLFGAKLPVPGAGLVKSILTSPALTKIATLGTEGGGSSAPPAKTTQQPVGLSTLNHGLGQTAADIGQGPQLNAEALQKATSGLDDNTTAAEANAKAFGETVAVYQNAGVTAAQFAAQTAQNTANMQAENNAAGILQQALGSLGGNVLGVDQANTQFYASITAVNASLKTNGTSLDISTAKGEANREAIEASIAAAQQHAQAIATQTGSTVQATAAYNTDIAALKAHLAATGLSKQAIDAYVDSIDAIKPLVETQIDVDAAAAQAVIDSLNRQLSTLGKTATGIEVTSEAVLRRAAAADGLFLQFYADGGMENHVAQMAPAGTMRVWAEPETGGESYIPHAESKRSRSEAILSKTANLFGGMYVPRNARSFADGGMVLRGTSGVGGVAGGNNERTIELHNHIELGGRRVQTEITKMVNEQNQWNNRLGR